MSPEGVLLACCLSLVGLALAGAIVLGLRPFDRLDLGRVTT